MWAELSSALICIESVVGKTNNIRYSSRQSSCTQLVDILLWIFQLFLLFVDMCTRSSFFLCKIIVRLGNASISLPKGVSVSLSGFCVKQIPVSYSAALVGFLYFRTKHGMTNDIDYHASVLWEPYICLFIIISIYLFIQYIIIQQCIMKTTQCPLEHQSFGRKGICADDSVQW